MKYRDLKITKRKAMIIGGQEGDIDVEGYERGKIYEVCDIRIFDNQPALIYFKGGNIHGYKISSVKFLDEN